MEIKLTHDALTLFGIGAVCCHLLGVASAVQAIMRARTSQGATAWAVFLISFPYLGLPLYWIFGRDRFRHYTVARKWEDEKLLAIERSVSPFPSSQTSAYRTLENLAGMSFNEGNEASLLVDGDATFAAIFETIDLARDYLLIQFFIVKDDELGRAFKSKVIDAAKRNVRVYFLFDEVGSHALPKSYQQALTTAGVEIRPFKTRKGPQNRFQVNFRNHRKIVIADGKVAFVGGHNVGDEYLGKDPKFGHWRDTHVRLSGPTVGQVQLSFAEDWNWSAGSVPSLTWTFEKATAPGMAVLALPTGPADDLDTCALFFLEAIQLAKKRLWITSPYFVPDLRIVSALQLAAMRGVDIRILIPSMADHLFVYWASFGFLKTTLPWNIKLFRYQGGFIHQKVLLVDDNFASVGTANFDNRSFRLNFEISLLFADRGFASEVEKMLVADFSRALPVTMAEYDDQPIYFRAAVHFSCLLAPIL